MKMRDSKTRVRARASGVEQQGLLARRCRTGRAAPTQSGDNGTATDGTKGGDKLRAYGVCSLAGRSRLIAGLEAVLGKTRRTEF
jgi:hypothetical protein